MPRTGTAPPDSLKLRDGPDQTRSGPDQGRLRGAWRMSTPLYADTLPGGKHWSFVMRRHAHLKLVDLEGGANVGMLFYNPANLLERYNAARHPQVPAHLQAHEGTLPLFRHGAHLLLDRRRHGGLARDVLRQHDEGDGQRALGRGELPGPSQRLAPERPRQLPRRGGQVRPRPTRSRGQRQLVQQGHGHRDRAAWHSTRPGRSRAPPSICASR